MLAERLITYLDENEVKYVVIRHSVAYTAQETAAAVHIRGEALAKTVVVRIDDELAMVVLPATHQVETALVRDFAGARSVEIVPESEFRSRFPDCELGAMPPFGNLYGMKVFVEESLGEAGEIAFNAGTHRDAVQLDFADYVRLVKPRILRAAAIH